MPAIVGIFFAIWLAVVGGIGFAFFHGPTQGMARQTVQLIRNDSKRLCLEQPKVASAQQGACVEGGGFLAEEIVKRAKASSIPAAVRDPSGFQNEIFSQAEAKCMSQYPQAEARKACNIGIAVAYEDFQRLQAAQRMTMNASPLTDPAAMVATADAGAEKRIQVASKEQGESAPAQAADSQVL